VNDRGASVRTSRGRRAARGTLKDPVEAGWVAAVNRRHPWPRNEAKKSPKAMTPERDAARKPPSVLEVCGAQWILAPYMLESARGKASVSE
jgi:hypothetical protein